MFPVISQVIKQYMDLYRVDIYAYLKIRFLVSNAKHRGYNSFIT